ncbi:hypothetical protein Esti_005730 [Eimeria stiedai]
MSGRGAYYKAKYGGALMDDCCHLVLRPERHSKMWTAELPACEQSLSLQVFVLSSFWVLDLPQAVGGVAASTQTEVAPRLILTTKEPIRRTPSEAHETTEREQLALQVVRMETISGIA